MKVFVVMDHFYQEEDFGGHQKHVQLNRIFSSKESAENYIDSLVPEEDDYYCSDLTFEIEEMDVYE